MLVGHAQLLAICLLPTSGVSAVIVMAAGRYILHNVTSPARARTGKTSGENHIQKQTPARVLTFLQRVAQMAARQHRGRL